MMRKVRSQPTRLNTACSATKPRFWTNLAQWCFFTSIQRLLFPVSQLWDRCQNRETVLEYVHILHGDCRSCTLCSMMCIWHLLKFLKCVCFSTLIFFGSWLLSCRTVWSSETSSPTCFWTLLCLATITKSCWQPYLLKGLAAKICYVTMNVLVMWVFLQNFLLPYINWDLT